jgi:hypothetical protein
MKGPTQLEEESAFGKTYLMNVVDDEFVHFTYESRADEILNDGALRTDAPYDKFGIEGVQAVSTVWGRHVRNVQYSRLEKGDERIVAVQFRTSTQPDIGYPEEVIWKQDVKLKQAQIIDFNKAKSLIESTPYAVEEGIVKYDRRETMSNLKNDLIRLGNQNPELRKHLRPVLDRLGGVRRSNGAAEENCGSPSR